MTPGGASPTIPVSVTFSAPEKRELELRALAVGRTLGEYIRERVLTEAAFEDRIFRFLIEELSRSAVEAQHAIAALDRRRATAAGGPEAHEAKRARIASEIRDSFTQREMVALVRLFESALEEQPHPEGEGEE